MDPTSVVEKTIPYKNQNSTAHIEFYDDFFVDKSDYYFSQLKDIDWDVMYELGSFGNPIIRNSRCMKWYSDYTYAFSNRSIGGVTLKTNEFTEGGLKGNSMTPILKEIRNKIIRLLKERGIEAEFNSVLVNYYKDEKDSVNWHSDNDPWLGSRFMVPSVSFGAERQFCLKPQSSKTQSDEMSWLLKDGSLLFMKGMTQEGWVHSVPKTKNKLNPRINLTFRQVKKSLIPKQPKGQNWDSFREKQLKKYDKIMDSESRIIIKNAKTPRELYPVLLGLQISFKKNQKFNLKNYLSNTKPNDPDYIFLRKIVKKCF